MATSPKASSLYGPGAFAGWLCTMASVFISWTCNRESKAQDTIGNDLIATLALPAIAAIHHQCELRKSTRNGTEPAMGSLDATYCIVVWFLAMGPCLLGLAAVTGRLKRCICNEIVLALCVSAMFAISDRHEILIQLPVTNGFLTFTMWNIFGGFATFLPLMIWHNDSQPRKESVSQVCDKYHQSGTYHGIRVRALSLLSLTTWLSVVAAVLYSVVQFFKPEGDGPEPFPIERLAVPQTGYVITELDQAVALSVGVLTVISTIYEALLSRRVSVWERHQARKASCEALLEEGVGNEVETLEWKRELRKLAQQEKETLDASTGVLATIERNKKELEEEEVAKLEMILRRNGLL